MANDHVFALRSRSIERASSAMKTMAGLTRAAVQRESGPRLRSLQSRIALFFAILLIAVLGLAFALVNASGVSIAKRTVAGELLTGERMFRRLVQQRNDQLTQATVVLAADFGFRQAVATNDLRTVASVLENHGSRIDASVAMLVGLDGRVIADTTHIQKSGSPFQLTQLLALAKRDGRAGLIALLDGRPYQLVMVPVNAPLPIAWVAMGFVMDDHGVRDLKAVTGLEVSLLSPQRGGEWTLFASTLAPAQRSALLAHPEILTHSRSEPVSLALADGELQTLSAPLGRGTEGTVVVAVLQRSLATGLEPFQRLRIILIGLALATVTVAIAGSMLLARSITRPINRLAALAQRIRSGDYAERAQCGGQGEVADLAQSFNHMLDGISQRESEILRLAYEDTLTGLPNRTRFNDRLEQAVRAGGRSGESVSVLLLNLDRFKDINESLGHAAGDQIIRAVGEVLSGSLREVDTIARLGGDEFAVLLPGATTLDVSRIVQRVLAALARPIALEGQPVDVGVSIGVASFPEHGPDGAAILRHADVAMHVAKEAATGFAIYDPRFDAGKQRHLSMLSELRRAVENHELVLYYQPKVRLDSGEVLRAEALVRWQHPERGFVAPEDFIPFAEQTGYIREITRWVLETALSQHASWAGQGMDVALAVNLSTRDLLSADLPQFVGALLEKYDVAPEALCLEITESGFMEDPARALETLTALNRLRVHLAIDDFGTGYSSLAYLKKLPVHQLKIDRSFVMHMVDQTDDATIVRSTIELGHNMGLEVVAEGVRNEATETLLREMGCDDAQGFFYSKPLPAADFAEWLTRHGAAMVAA
jgi:diguanylate cyclase (GGDEF)-like protein